MRIVTAAILSLITSASVCADTTGFSRVELVQELAMGEMKKLLGWSEGRFYFAKKSGAVNVVDKDGRQLVLLQANDSKGNPVLEQPEAVATYKDVIYVVDSDTDRVAMFTPQGNYKGSFGDKGGNSLSSPTGVAVRDGIVYVADTGNKRVQLYGTNGVYLTALEIDSAVENIAAKEKELPYKLDEPVDIEIDALGQIYVLDKDDGLIKVYSPNGAYLRHLPAGGKPVALSIARDGIYVADRDSFAINKYDFNGKLAYSFGSKGKGRAQFASLAGLATDQDRQVFVGDSEKGMADVFRVEAGAPFEPAVKTPSRVSVRWEQLVPASLGKIVWDGKGAIYGIDESDKKNVKLVKIVNGAVAGEIRLNDLAPSSIAFDKSGGMWALDKKKERVVKLDGAGAVQMSFGASGSDNGEFDDPEDIAISSAGTIFVADSGNGRVQAFSSDGVFLKEIRNDSAGKLDEPTAIALNAQDTIYVLDKGRAIVAIYSAKGEPMGVLGKQAGEGALKKPVSLMVTRDEVFVLDSNQVKVYTHKGQYVRSFAANGNGAGELGEPQSITATGDETFAISERGNKRLQTFTTLHTPTAPAQLAATGAVHAIELRWAASELPYVKQYQIYRSQGDNSAFVQVATSKTNQYTDQGLEPDRKYYYRVVGETQYGFVGPRSDSVSGVPKKYSPPKLAGVQVEPSPMQLKLSWKPIETEYFKAYLIYQKAGEVLTKVGETTLPEFVRDSLAPNTQYSLHVATLSTDGTESEKFEVIAATLPSNTEPLEIEVVKLHDVFSNTYKLYEEEGIGRIRLINNTDKLIENIKVSFMLNNFMDYPTEGKIDRLLPGQSEEITLKSVFNNNILNITEDSSIQAEIKAGYFLDGVRDLYSKNATITVYDKHRMTWDEHDRVASFVTPKDTPIINFARAVATQFSETKDESQLAALLFNAMGVMGLTYIQNPTNPYQVSLTKTATEKIDTVDYVQYPRETLERRSGDCVDLVTFYSTALEGMGIRTLMLEVPDHLLMMFSTGIKADEDGYTMNDMFVIHDGLLWIPVETTVVGRPFTKAWELGAENYYKWKGKGLNILDIHKSWDIYKPATLPSSTFKTPDIAGADVEKKFPGDFASMLKISSQTKTRRYLQAIQKNPADMESHLQVGIILAKIGDRKEAMKYFDKVISVQPKNAAALNNRGNIHMLDGKYSEAQKAYLAASQSGSTDPYIFVNLAKAYKALNDTKSAKDAFVKAVKLDPAVKEKHKAMALELLNAL
ncbi:MAG: hypothetical protein HY938_08370 [Nitrosomonadales bacterium]|nr:hypothetical protein [Nitrosomonadales bacterium]